MKPQTTRPAPLDRTFAPIVLTGWILSLTGCGGGCSPGVPIPDADFCATPDATSVTSVEMGSGDDEGFKPWSDGDIARLVYGPQGGAMIQMKIRVQGQEMSCIGQRTVLRYPIGYTVLEDTTTLRVYPQGDGSYHTRPHFLIMGFPEPTVGAQLVVETTLDGAIGAHTIRLDDVYTGPAPLGLSPSSAEIAVGEVIDVELTLDRPADSYMFIPLHSADESVALPREVFRDVPSGEATTTLSIEGVAPGGPVDVSAIVGDRVISIPITVVP